jgi:hypothetical protein
VGNGKKRSGFLNDQLCTPIRNGMMRCTDYVVHANNLMVLEHCPSHQANLRNLARWINNNSNSTVYLRTDVSEKDMLSVIIILCSFHPKVHAPQIAILDATAL